MIRYNQSHSAHHRPSGTTPPSCRAHRGEECSVIFEDKFTVQAPADRVWAFLLDPKCIAACMPGVENVTQVDDHTFDASISARVGPMSGKFEFRATIVESQPPTEMAANVDGVDSVTKSTIQARMGMTLRSLAATETEVAYRATVDVKGRLAILGEMVLRTTATLIVQEAIRRMRAQLESSATA